MNRMFIEPERATSWHAGMGKPANVRAGGVAVKPRGIGRVGVDWGRADPRGFDLAHAELRVLAAGATLKLPRNVEKASLFAFAYGARPEIILRNVL